LNCLINRPPSRLHKIKTLPVPDPQVPSQLLEAVEDKYLRRYFRRPVARITRSDLVFRTAVPRRRMQLA
jgi:hypothetical protein